MARLRISLIMLLWLYLASCTPSPTEPGLSAGQDESRPTATNIVEPGTPQLVILSPLQIDEKAGRLFAVAQVNGESKIAVLDTRDGRLLAAWNDPGQLALDVSRERLVVDRGAQGVTLLDSATGETQGIVTLPSQDSPPAPQINSQTGLVYAFRGSTIYVIDPAIRNVVRSITLEVPATTCDAPAGNAAIYQTAVDPAVDRLFLSFITRTCIPWATTTVITYDAEVKAESGRIDIDINSQFLPYDGRLFGMSANRLGPANAWGWDGAARRHDENINTQGKLSGIVLDRKRKLIYEAIGETAHIFNTGKQEIEGRVVVPLLADGRLAGHDPGSDNLFIISATGRLYLWPAGRLFDNASSPVPAPSPLPIATVKSISPAPNWTENQAMAALLEVTHCGGTQLFIMANPTSGWLPSRTNADADCESVTAVAFSPAYKQDSLLFAAINQPPTILRSLDAGHSWTAAETPFLEATRFTALLPSPDYSTDQTLYALTSAGLLYRSRDGGRNWKLLDQRIDQVTLAGGSGLSLSLYGAFGGRLLHSANGGDKWQEVGPTPNGESLMMLQAAPSAGDFPLLYAFTGGGHFARSIDGGLNWNPIMETSPGPADLAIASGVAEEQRPIFLLNDRIVTASYDGMAAVWSATAADEANRYRPTAIAIAPDFASAPFLFVGTADGQIVRIRADVQP